MHPKLGFCARAPPPQLESWGKHERYKSWLTSLQDTDTDTRYTRTNEETRINAKSSPRPSKRERLQLTACLCNPTRRRYSAVRIPHYSNNTLRHSIRVVARTEVINQRRGCHKKFRSGRIHRAEEIARQNDRRRSRP